MYMKDSRRCQAPQIFKLRRTVLGIAAVALAGALLVSPAAAQDTKTEVSTRTTVNGKVTQQTQTELKQFAGLGWGLGIAANFDVRSRSSQQLSSAQIVNGIVRTTDTSGNATVSFVLEAHYFFKDVLIPFVAKDACGQGFKGSIYNCTEFAQGPFIAIEVGGGTKSAVDSNDPISGYALGWMIGMRHPNSPNPNSSWNIGVGLRLSPKGSVLGDGFVANQPPPAGETAIRYKTEPRTGVMLLSSFSF